MTALPQVVPSKQRRAGLKDRPGPSLRCAQHDQNTGYAPKQTDTVRVVVAPIARADTLKTRWLNIASALYNPDVVTTFRNIVCGVTRNSAHAILAMVAAIRIALAIISFVLTAALLVWLAIACWIAWSTCSPHHLIAVILVFCTLGLLTRGRRSSSPSPWFWLWLWDRQVIPRRDGGMRAPLRED